jgi:hypothetical protein
VFNKTVGLLHFARMPALRMWRHQSPQLTEQRKKELFLDAMLCRT